MFVEKSGFRWREISSVCVFGVGFRVVIEGTDAGGNPFRRCDPVVVVKSDVIIKVIMDSSGKFTMQPGDVLKVNITVENRSPYTDTYTVSVSDTEGLYQGTDPDM